MITSGFRIIDPVAGRVYPPQPINRKIKGSRATMTDQNIENAFRGYLHAFSVTLTADREKLIRCCVTDDLIFSNPGVEGRGVEMLLDHIVRFQDAYPGACFRINWLRQQHGQILAEWTQLDGDGSEGITAHSYAKSDGSGRIVQFAGFWTSD